MSLEVVVTVLIAGGNGFVGSHIVDAVLATGRQVRVLSPSPELFRPPNEAVEYHYGRLDLGARLEHIVSGCEAVIDAASSSVPASADLSPALAISSAVGSSTWLGELCLRSGVQTFVYLSSGGTVYGRGTGKGAHRETDALAPIGSYGALKAATELSLAAVLSNSDVRNVCLRVTNAYGERQNPQRPQGIVGVALTRLRMGRPITLYGDTVRDFIHVHDVATAVVRALEGDLVGAYNIGSGVGVAVSDLVVRLERIVGRRLHIEHLPARAFDVPHSVVDTDLARSAGWAPTVDLDDGLRRTWRWAEGAIS